MTVTAKCISAIVAIILYSRFRTKYAIFPDFKRIFSIRCTQKNKITVNVLYSILEKKAANLLQLIPTVLLGMYCSAESVSVFKIAVKIAEIPSIFFNGFLKNVTAKLPEMKVKMCPQKFVNFVLKMLLGLESISLLLAIFMYFAFPFLTRIFGDGYSVPHTARVILCIRIGGIGLAILGGTLSRMFDKLKQSSFINIFTSILFFYVGCELVQNFQTTGIFIHYTATFYFSTILFYLIIFKDIYIRSKNKTRIP